MPAVMLGVFAVTLLLSAMLLFFIELMVGKMMLPLLGGTPAVWNTCMVFFQAILMAGYGFAHWSTSVMGPRRQGRLQLAILVLPIAVIVINAVFFFGLLEPNKNLVQGRESSPITLLLIVLTLSVGLPMFVVCTVAPLLQRWFSSTDHPAAKDPYFLYGASNFGSMLMLTCYPVFFEPLFALKTQQVMWVSGYVVLAGLIAACAVLMWKSKPAAEVALDTGAGSGGTAPEAAALAATPAPEPAHAPAPAPAPAPAATPAAGTAAIKIADKGIARQRKGQRREKPRSPRPTDVRPADTRPAGRPARPAARPREEVDPSTQPITAGRVARWVLLAAVPSSLMLGATTYITTDITPMPMMWMLPLAVYLLTFIIVFATIFRVYQAVITTGALIASITLVAQLATSNLISNRGLQLLVWLIAFGGMFASLFILWVRDSGLLHKVMVMVMPLVVLLLLFLQFAGVKPPSPTTFLWGWKLPSVIITLMLHLLTLFLVSMVCHGELARDRPQARELTRFFLWMSFGGVLGGLFNGLLAPLIFPGIVEYHLVLVFACLLLPPLGYARFSSWARYADVILAVIFVVVGMVLLYLVWAQAAQAAQDKTVRPVGSMAPLYDGPIYWITSALLAGAALGCLAAALGWGSPPKEEDETASDVFDRVFDVVLPLTLFLLVLGLYWGLRTQGLDKRVVQFAGKLGVEVGRFRSILVFGVTAVLCYTFVERSLRFGLGVGAIVLAAATSEVIRDPAMYQTRSFFGVLRVERSHLFGDRTRLDPTNRGEPNYFLYDPVNRLVHGTTLHGEQIIEEPYEDQEYFQSIPLSYYHRTGPVGLVYQAHNVDPKRPFAVIGLGTGTMAAYGLPGQRVDFYDIDPKVVGISFDTNQYFTFVDRAQDRGVDISLILGDARLTFEPKGERQRLKPLNNRKGFPKRERDYQKKPLTPDDQYGLIVVDAFSSDAIPVHLLTREAIEIYLRRLMDDGVLCIHISNRYLDLQPVLANIVEHLREKGMTYRNADGEEVHVDLPGLTGYHMSDDDNEAPGKNRSHWVAIVKDKKHMRQVLAPNRWDARPGLALGEVDPEFATKVARAAKEGQPHHGVLSLWGASLWPAPVGTPMSLGCNMLNVYRMVETRLEFVDGVDEKGNKIKRSQWLKDDRAVHTEWEPLETVPQLQKMVAEQNAKLRDRDTDKSDRERAIRRIALMEEKLRKTQAVGVWTDDYSNLWRVFTGMEDAFAFLMALMFIPPLVVFVVLILQWAFPDADT